jgi:hypothetical protein
VVHEGDSTDMTSVGVVYKVRPGCADDLSQPLDVPERFHFFSLCQCSGQCWWLSQLMFLHVFACFVHPVTVR